MRGRTNVQDGIFLNANVGEYEVATGQNIVAGNMVTMYTENGEPLDLGSSNYTQLNKAWLQNFSELSDGNYVAGNQILSKNGADGFDVVSTLTVSWLTNKNLKYIGNDTFISIAMTRGNSVSGGYSIKITVSVLVVDVNNNYAVSKTDYAFTGTQKIMSTSSHSYYVDVLDFLDGKIIGYLRATASSSFGYTLFHIDYSDVTNISLVFDATNWGTSASVSGYIADLSNSSIYANNAFYYTNSSTLFKFYFDNGTLTISSTSLPYPSGSTGSTSNDQNTLYKVDENGEVGAFYKKSVTGGFELHNIVFSMSGFQVTGILKDENVYTFTSPHGYSYSNITLYQLDTYTYLMCIYGSTISSRVPLAFAIVKNQNGMVFYEPYDCEYLLSDNYIGLSFAQITSLQNMDVRFSQYVANAKIVDNQFILNGENKKYVKNATNEQYIRGIAKQSGVAGDTIEVYIPQV